MHETAGMKNQKGGAHHQRLLSLRPQSGARRRRLLCDEVHHARAPRRPAPGGAVATELAEHIREPEIAESIRERVGGIAIPADSFEWSPSPSVSRRTSTSTGFFSGRRSRQNSQAHIIRVAGFIGILIGAFLKERLYRTLIVIPAVLAVIAVALVAFENSLMVTAVLLGIWGTYWNGRARWPGGRGWQERYRTMLKPAAA